MQSTCLFWLAEKVSFAFLRIGDSFTTFSLDFKAVLQQFIHLFCSQYLDDAVICTFCNRTVGLWLLRGEVFDVEKQHQKWCIFGSSASRNTDLWQDRRLVLQHLKNPEVNFNVTEFLFNVSNACKASDCLWDTFF